MRTTNAEIFRPPAPALGHLPKLSGAVRVADRIVPETADSKSPARRAGLSVLLACGNPLRQDDGIGWRIAEAVDRMAEQGNAEPMLRVIAVQQWTPELAEEISGANLAVFVDASAADEPGAIRVTPICSPASAPPPQMRGTQRFEVPISETHALDPDALLALAERICGRGPARAFLVTVGAESFQFGEEMSASVRRAVPRAVRLVANLVIAFCGKHQEPGSACQHPSPEKPSLIHPD